MFNRRRFNTGLTALAVAPLASLARAAEPIRLEAFKDESCGCCGLWVEHMESQGFACNVRLPDDLNAVKERFGIPPQFQSCHTAVSTDGFLFEGHVPARFVAQFLAAPPAGARGLMVPGMPLGSPGMEVEDRFTPYDILALMADGSAAVYASMRSRADQF